ncbi:MAG TPA: hypothetical protein VMB05_03615 [Solirubrobacteraceae bacterium]|nr:hypothetical protein [Solirubrobacteraceae bacterium]
MNGRSVHRSGTIVLSVLMAAIGLALIGQVIAGDGGGVLSARLLLGVLFLAGGVARLWIERKRGGRT